MDPDKLLKFFSENLSEWSRATFLTLISPTSRFALVPISSESPPRLDGHAQQQELWLNPKLIWFATFSALLGTTLNGLLPQRIPPPQLAVALAVIFGSWFFYAAAIHVVCKLLKGRAHFLETVSVSIQVSATLYVVNSFVSLVVATLATVPSAKATISMVPVVGDALADEPALFFFLVGTVLFSIYQPLALRTLHRFSWPRTAVIAVLPYTFVWFSIAFYHRTGVLSGVAK